MGTRSKTFVIEDTEKAKANDRKGSIAMYRQMDGYPGGHGLDLAEFLNPFIIINGISFDDREKTRANGLDCLAAQMVKHFKVGIGSIYLDASPDVTDLDYYYIVYQENDNLKMACYDSWKNEKLFEGTPQEFIDWINN